MGLYWKDIEIKPGMTIEVDLLHNDPVKVIWRILSFGSRKSDDAYIDYVSGKKYPLSRVIKKRKLHIRIEQGQLLQLPAGSEFMIVQEYQDGEDVGKHCYNLDMLQTVRNIRVLDRRSEGGITP